MVRQPVAALLSPGCLRFDLVGFLLGTGLRLLHIGLQLVRFLRAAAWTLAWAWLILWVSWLKPSWAVMRVPSPHREDRWCAPGADPALRPGGLPIRAWLPLTTCPYRRLHQADTNLAGALVSRRPKPNPQPQRFTLCYQNPGRGFTKTRDRKSTRLNSSH